ncbi:MAG TPA: DciA family protein [Gammaproteobacteria bacterium]|nr:DciA family protein [Gammaproteobacteria bacterium]
MTQGRFPVSMGEWLAREGGDFGDLLAAARRLRALERVVARCLPEIPAHHLRAARYQDGRLVLETDSPVWSARLRYQTPSLRRCLEREGLDLREILVRIAPERRPMGTLTASRSARISRESAGFIRRYAATVRDPALRAALERLSGRHQDTPDPAAPCAPDDETGETPG